VKFNGPIGVLFHEKLDLESSSFIKSLLSLNPSQVEDFLKVGAPEEVCTQRRTKDKLLVCESLRTT
jgi:hypothetical protein